MMLLTFKTANDCSLLRIIKKKQE